MPNFFSGGLCVGVLSPSDRAGGAATHHGLWHTIRVANKLNLGNCHAALLVPVFEGPRGPN